MSRKLIREPALRQKLGDISKSTFFRRYRFNANFPRPVNTPDGGLAYWEHEVDAALEKLGHTDEPRSDVEPAPAHWATRGNRRGNSKDTRTDAPPEAA
jgi:predicted DNA-binding transcriptional regulator AlpA